MRPRTAPAGRRPRGAATIAATLLAVTATWSCALVGREAPDAAITPGSRGPEEGVETSVRVTNETWSDMTIYLLRPGTRMRLGTVTSMGTATFPIPRSWVRGSASLRLLADPVGSVTTFSSDAVIVWPGDALEWRLVQPLRHSTLRIFARS